MFFLIPYHVDVPMECRPWMNWALIGITILVYPLAGESLVLGVGPLGWVGYVLCHADLVHLLGNMLFLWVFGNAVCAKLGNVAYLFVYFGLGLVAGLVSYAADPGPLVGASGAINGVVGLFVVWYLLNEISVWYAYWLFSVAGTGTFAVSSFWMVLLWGMFDVWGVIRGAGNTDHVAHLAGFVTGFALAVLLLKAKWVVMTRGERSLLQAVFGGRAC